MSNSTNSTVMSYGPVTNYTDTAPSGLSVCANYQNTTGSIVLPMAYILPNSTVNITFGGSPPYNLSSTFLPYNGVASCGPLGITLNSSTFTWQVGNNNSAHGSTYSYGDSFVFYAEQTTAAGGQNYSVYASYYLTVSNSTTSLGGTPVSGNPSNPKSSASKNGLGWKGAGLAVAFGVALLSVL